MKKTKPSFKMLFLKNIVVSIVSTSIPVFASYYKSPSINTITNTFKNLLADEITQNILISFAFAYGVATILKKFLWIQNKKLLNIGMFIYWIIKDLFVLFKSVLLCFSGITIIMVSLWPVFEPNTFSMKGLLIILFLSYPYLLIATFIDYYDNKYG